MDTLRGNFSGQDSHEEHLPEYDYADDDTGREQPPLAIGQDERRMQVRAYNFWASLLVDKSFPSIEELDPDNLPDFGPYSVLLDFTAGIENPTVTFLGGELAHECGTEGPIAKLSDVPSRSLLSRITDHYLQIIANQAPIGFEAEFVNQRGATIMYRGILLPFSSDDDTIDFIYGVINWKELADQQTTDKLLLEIDQALEVVPESARIEGPLTEWADGPPEIDHDGVLDLVTPIEPLELDADYPEPTFGDMAPAGFAQDKWDGDEDEPLELTSEFAALADEPFELAVEAADEMAAADAEPLELSIEAIDDFPGSDAGFGAAAMAAAGSDGLLALADVLADDNPDTMELADWLASARELALAAEGTEDRSRQTLYAAIGRAYDFSLAADADPEGFAELVADSGLTVQERAPMTPVVKLVFGAAYDKTRIAEYSSALGHARRQGVARGSFADYLASAPGGLKGIVTAERRLRREEFGSARRQAPGSRRKARPQAARAGALRTQRSIGGRQRVHPAGRPASAQRRSGAARRSRRRRRAAGARGAQADRLTP